MASTRAENSSHSTKGSGLIVTTPTAEGGICIGAAVGGFLQENNSKGRAKMSGDFIVD
jgi:hypothetical protein